MEKKLLTKTLLHLQSRKPILWYELKHFKFEDNDEIIAGYVEPWENGPDNSGGDHYEVEIRRQVLETDEEFNKRIEKENHDKTWARNRRYENYLKLKQEFEPDSKPSEFYGQDMGDGVTVIKRK